VHRTLTADACRNLVMVVLLYETPRGMAEPHLAIRREPAQ
jgi:hypothetical protein